MSAPILPTRDSDDVDALVTDLYLDALLAASDGRGDEAPGGMDVDPGIRVAARVLGRSLVRVHPSFRFEERLASRLAGLAAAQAGLPAPVGAPSAAAATRGMLLAFPAAAAARASGAAATRTQALAAAGASFAAAEADPLLDAILRGDLDPSDAEAVDRAGRLDGTRRPLILGGAVMSAAISLAGVAWVAWRAFHPAGGTITRAARIRRATAVLPAGGLGGPA